MTKSARWSIFTPSISLTKAAAASWALKMSPAKQAAIFWLLSTTELTIKEILANLAASFISALIWCIVPFLAGLCAVGQPVGALIPAFKGIGVGMTFAALVNIYGANGIPAFAVFVLPSAFIGTVICCYQCRLSVLCSNSVLAVLKGRRDEAPHYYKIYLERFAVCCIGCFLLGIADAVITFLFRPIFVI